MTMPKSGEEPTAFVVGNAADHRRAVDAVEELKRTQRRTKAAERENCIGELAELLVVIEKEVWEFPPQKRAVMAGIKLAMRELQGQKRPR